LYKKLSESPDLYRQMSIAAKERVKKKFSICTNALEVEKIILNE